MTTLLASLLVLLAAADDGLRPGDHTRSIRVGDLDRRYLVHVPPLYDPEVAMPVVLAFHGGGTNATSMAVFSGLDDKADETGFIVVYPEGTGRLRRMLTFNAGNCCGHAADRNVDDVAFTRALLDDLGSVANIDPRRVYATGMSNGARMAYRVRSDRRDRPGRRADGHEDVSSRPGRPRHPFPRRCRRVRSIRGRTGTRSLGDRFPFRRALRERLGGGQRVQSYGHDGGARRPGGRRHLRQIGAVWRRH